MKRKPKYRYEIYVPVREIWVMEVEADSDEEALLKVRGGEAWQLHSLAGSTRSGETEIISRVLIEDKKCKLKRKTPKEFPIPMRGKS